MSRGIKLGASAITGGGGSTTGKIVVDTTNLVATDIVRVQSLVNPSVIYNETVGTPGDYIVFTVDSDLYKICLVQEIEETPTEVVTIKRTVDVGQCLEVNALNKTTLGGIQAILNSHTESELLSIGDEVTITVNNEPWVMQIAGINLYDTHEVTLVSKDIYAMSIVSNHYTNSAFWNDTTSYLLASLTAFYNAMLPTEAALLKQIEKNMRGSYNSNVWSTYTAKVFVPNSVEIFGTTDAGTPSLPTYQYPLFLNQADRIKYYQNTVTNYWTCDGATNRSADVIMCTKTGTKGRDGGINADPSSGVQAGVVPCFRLTADS